MEKVTYTPTGFAEIFGKERTWAYRQLYAGKVQAVTGIGRTLIPKSEVDRLLKEAGRYLGAKVKVKKQDLPALAAIPITKSEWQMALSRRRNSGNPAKAAANDSKEAGASRKAAYRRLTGQKSANAPSAE